MIRKVKLALLLLVISSQSPKVNLIQIPTFSSKNIYAIFTPFSSKTDWKTYKNDKYGFEFKYDKNSRISYVGAGSATGTSLLLTLADDRFIKDSKNDDISSFFDHLP